MTCERPRDVQPDSIIPGRVPSLDVPQFRPRGIQSPRIDSAIERECPRSHTVTAGACAGRDEKACYGALRWRLWGLARGIATGSRSRSAQRNARGSRAPEGSRTRTGRIGAGGRPLACQTEVAAKYSSVRACPPYQSAIVIRLQTVVGSASTALSFGRRWPFFADRPVGWLGALGGGSARLASRRSRVMMQT